MSFPRKLSLALALTLAACKSTGGRDASLAAWELDGNKQAAQDYIISTVESYYKDAKGQTAALSDFAQALADQRTDQTETATYVLQGYYEASKSSSLEGDANPLQQYIIQQFVIMTNYIAFHNDPAKYPLQYLGNQ